MSQLWLFVCQVHAAAIPTPSKTTLLCSISFKSLSMGYLELQTLVTRAGKKRRVENALRQALEGYVREMNEEYH